MREREKEREKKRERKKERERNDEMKMCIRYANSVLLTMKGKVESLHTQYTFI